MRIFLEKGCREDQKTHFRINTFFYFENGAVCEIMWSRAGHR